MVLWDLQLVVSTLEGYAASQLLPRVAPRLRLVKPE